MAVQIQRRRGNTAQTAVFTGAFAESTIDTDKKVAVIHDGVTQGGFPGARESTLNVAFGLANTVLVTANHAYDTANAAFAAANTGAGGSAAFPQANTARDTANLAYNTANAAFNNSNVAGNFANAAATAAYASANAAFAKANAALANTTTTLGGSLTVSGNIKLLGSTSGTVTIQAPATQDPIGSDPVPFILPATNGFPGLVLTTDGAGNTSWQPASTVGIATFFFSNNTSDIAGANVVNVFPQAYQSNISIASAVAGDTIIGTFITPLGFPGLTIIPTGLISIESYDQQVSGTKVYTMYASIKEVSNTGAFIGYIANTGNTDPFATSSPHADILNATTPAANGGYVMQSANSRIAVDLHIVGAAAGSAGTVKVFQGGTSDSQITIPADLLNTIIYIPYQGASRGVDLGGQSFQTSGNTTLKGNVIVTTAVSGYLKTDASGNVSSDGFALQLEANNAYNTANAAFINSNSGANFANAAATAAYNAANAAFGNSNVAANYANTQAGLAYATANAAFGNSNTGANFANAAATAAYASANAISATANVALNTANLAYLKAQSAVQLGFTAVAANGNGTVITASSNNDTLIFANTGNVVVTANAAGGKNLFIDLTTTGASAGIYGSPTVIPIVTVDSRGRVTAISNVAASSGSGVAQFFANTPTSTSISPGASGLVLANTANIYTANVGTTNIIFELTTTGATAGIYGAPTVIPIVTVDSRGRVTSISNVAASAGSGVAQFFANTPTSVSVSPGASGLVLQNTANIYVSNTGTTNLFHELTTTGVTAAAYGNSLFGATFTVDSRGRIVTAAPVLMGDAIDAYNTANSAFGNSNTAGNFANAAATAAYASANAISATANVALNTANLAYAKAQSAVQLGFTAVAANGNGVVITAASNSDTLIFANTGNITVTANAAGGKNLFIDLTTTGVAAGVYGNALFTPQITLDSRGRVVLAAPVLHGDAIDAYNTANSAFGNSNTGANFANAAATAAYASANNVSSTANIALNTANLAYAKAQAAVQLGFTSVAANGNGVVISASSNSDTLIFANTGNVVITANAAGGKNLYIDLTTTGVTAGAYGNALYGLTLTVDSRGRIVTVAAPLIGDAIDAYNTANSAFGNSNVAGNFANAAATAAYASANAISATANVALNTANLAYLKAQSAVQLGFTAVAANGNGVVISASSNNDTLIFANTGNVVITANAAGGKNLFFDLTTTGATQGIYGSPTVIPIVTVDSRGRVTAISNVAASAGSGVAQFFANTPTSVSVSPGASGLVLANTANIYIANTGTTNLYFELTTTGVTAGVYGNATIIPIVTVDSRGRVTAISNVSAAGGGGNAFAFANANGILITAGSADTLNLVIGGALTMNTVAATKTVTISDGGTIAAAFAAANSSANVVPTSVPVPCLGLSNTVIAIASNTAATLMCYYIYNPNANVAYIQLLDINTPGNVFLSAANSAPKWSLGIPPVSAANLSKLKMLFANGIMVAATTTSNGSTALALGVDCNFSRI